MREKERETGDGEQNENRKKKGSKEKCERGWEEWH